MKDFRLRLRSNQFYDKIFEYSDADWIENIEDRQYVSVMVKTDMSDMMTILLG